MTIKGRNKDPFTGRYPLLVEGFSRVGNLEIHHVKGVEVMSTADLDLYVVKVRRHYGPREATSILHGPVNRAKAEERLALLIDTYQDPDAYYIEKWEKK